LLLPRSSGLSGGPAARLRPATGHLAR